MPLLLPFWFANQTLQHLQYLVVSPGSFAFDIKLYRLAAEAWLAGGDPSVPTLYWDALPPLDELRRTASDAPAIPFVRMGSRGHLHYLVFMLVSGTAAIWRRFRRLGLPLWWILFPPLVQCIWVGNLNVFVIALLVAGGTAAGAIATTLKTYAAVPLVLTFQWRAMAGRRTDRAPLRATPAMAAIHRSVRRDKQCARGTGLGRQTPVLPQPWATIGGAIALIALGRKRAAWLAVPVLWPSTQWHYVPSSPCRQ